MSEARTSDLYRAIRDPITDLRVVLQLTPEADAQVAQLEHAIWRRVQKALALPVPEAK